VAGKSGFCRNCGNKLAPEADVCVKCGVAVESKSLKRKERKEMWLGILLALIVPGLGQIYTDQSFGKAAAIFCTSFLILPYLYGIYDTYREIKKINGEE